MNTIKRIDPRRPFVVTAAGLKRITPGDAGNANAGDAPQPAHGTGMTATTAMATAATATKPRRTRQTPTRTLLVVAHSDRGALDDPARQALAAAALIADAATCVVLLVFGALHDDASAPGADQLIELPWFDASRFAPDDELAALAQCVARFSPAHILLPDNATGDGDLGRRYAAHAGASIATHVVQIDATHASVYAYARQSVYVSERQHMLATRTLPDIVLLAPGAVDPRLPFVGAGERIDAGFIGRHDADVRIDANIAAGAGIGANPIDEHDASNHDADERTQPSRYKDLGVEVIDAAQMALEEADFIVSAGNGVRDVTAFARLAHVCGAAIGASRVAVDNGLFRRDQQIGATGKTVAASVYLAFGISGAVQHLQGIKDCRHVIAVNLDASAPIVKRANLTLVGDAQPVIAALLDEIARARASNAANVANAGNVTGATNTPREALAAPLIRHVNPHASRHSRPTHANRRSPGMSSNAPAKPQPGSDVKKIAVLVSIGQHPVSNVPCHSRNDAVALTIGYALAAQHGARCDTLHASADTSSEAAFAALADYLALGAPRVDVLTCAETDDVANVADLLATRLTGYDLVLTGTRAQGAFDSGMLPYQLAHALGYPLVGAALEVKIEKGHADRVDHAVVRQFLPRGMRRRVSVRLPAVVAIHPLASADVRYAYARLRSGEITLCATNAATNDNTADRANDDTNDSPNAATDNGTSTATDSKTDAETNHETLAAPGEKTARLTPAPSPWTFAPATRQPVRLAAAEKRSAHLRMLLATAAESRGGRVVIDGTSVEKAQAILAYLREHRLVDY